jgi:RecQ family ATP-dependent DNA helicase
MTFIDILMPIPPASASTTASVSSEEELKQYLKGYFGYDTFRPQQIDIITHIIAGRDTLVLMPTGAGKSICYQLPALCQTGLTVVISPLISLMFDQVKDLQSRHITAYHYNSTSVVPLGQIIDEVKQGTCNILYTTPETLIANVPFMMELENLHESGQLRRFIVDEAHCVSNWGHDFRPSYLGLHVKTWFQGIQVCAFTATATALVANDIIKNLSLENPYIARTSFIKTNIQYRIRKKEQDGWGYIGNSLAKTINELGYMCKTGIVYCLSRRECEYMSKVLQNRGLAAAFYHAQIPQVEKDRIQTAWLHGGIKVIVATIAFALGINKPDVRYVIHTSMPNSIESYYQQTGRAGRDDQPAHCVLYYSEKDVDILVKMVTNESTDKNLIPPVRNTDRIDDMYHLCQNNRECLKLQMCNYLGEYLVRENCPFQETKCYNCLTNSRFGPKTKDQTDMANILLDASDGKSLSETKRNCNYLERRIVLHLLNDGNMIAEIDRERDPINAIERLHKVTDVYTMII